MKIDWNKVRRVFGMKELCPECGGEIPYSPMSWDEEAIADGSYIRCSVCKGAKPRSEPMKENNTPKLDYWMMGLLIKAVDIQMRKVSSKYPRDYIESAIEDRNQWNPLGQLQVIKDRLNEIQLHYDEEIKEGLDNGHNKRSS